MLDLFSAWRKASKCKKVIKRVQCRLHLLKNKRMAMAKQLREDVAYFLKNSYEETASKRLEQLYKDENAIAIYELLGHFCEFILLNLSYIRRHRELPNDINEAVSSLIFVSARYGDLPELIAIRRFFGERYGQRFVETATELYPGNLVNRQIIQKMSSQSVPDSEKQRMLEEIIRDCFFPSGILALEYRAERAGQEIIVEYDDKVSPHPYVDNQKYQTLSHPPKSDSCFVTSNNSHSTTWAIVPSSPVNGLHQDQNVDAISVPLTVAETRSPRRLCAAAATPHYEEEKMNDAASSPASAYSEASGSFEFRICNKDTVVYLNDDVEEFWSPSMNDVNSDPDQRVFVFKPTVGQKKIENYLLSIPDNERLDKPYHEPGAELQGSVRSSAYKSYTGMKSSSSAGKRLRRRALSQEKRSISNVVVATHYGNLQKKHRKRNVERENHQTNVGDGVDECRCQSHHRRSSTCHCSLVTPCYFYASGKNDGYGVIVWRKKKPVTSNLVDGCKHTDLDHVAKQGNSQVDNLCQSFRFQEDHSQEMGIRPPTDQISSSNSATNTEFEFGTVVGSNNSDVSRPLVAKKGERSPPPYSRAMTMVVPQKYDNDSEGIDQVARSISLPPASQFSSSGGGGGRTDPPTSPSHVHPKLPDYDEIAAKFRALKKVHQENQKHFLNHSLK